MKDELITILKTFGYPVRLQGSFGAKEKYPDSFFTFWNNEVTDGNHYDNDAVSFIWDFTVYFFSTDPDKVNSTLVTLRKRLRAAGWIVDGLGYDTPTDEPTHTGRALDVLYIQRNKQEE